jgi:hypothetical protein
VLLRISSIADANKVLGFTIESRLEVKFEGVICGVGFIVVVPPPIVLFILGEV